ncbi:hypothetical protein F5Y19DRAFT_386760 [Xylariaceae sp. FL1651]|nr:hypothetical protein F5Y19DRAFT_386760 [Xylariaceae sp. FL1651]
MPGHARTHKSASGWFNLYQHLETQEINSQLSSPFYSGLIPTEIRNLIFEYAMTESPSPHAAVFGRDTLVQFSHDPAPMPEIPDSSLAEYVKEKITRISSPLQNPLHRSRSVPPSAIARDAKDGFDWLRFDNTEPTTVGVALLLTCRRAYLEAHSLPLLQTEQRFYCGYDRGPPRYGSKVSRADMIGFIKSRLSEPAPVPGLQQKDLVRSARLFLQQYWLEDKLLQVTRTDNWFPNLEHLRITLRRSDWWDWENDATLRINPFKGNCYYPHTVNLMRQDMLAETGNVDFGPEVWGRLFSNMSKLKTLTIDFETSENKRQEMEDIVTWAVKWRFPLSEGQHLSTDGQSVSKMSWRGLPHHWSDRCSPGDRFERNKLYSHGYGPQLLVWTVQWKSVQNE